MCLPCGLEGPGVRTLIFTFKVADSIPGGGAKILQAGSPVQ